MVNTSGIRHEDLRSRSEHALAVAGAPPPWHDVPIHEGRDLASDALWELSLALARAKRKLSRNPPRLPKLRRASVSVVVAAVAAAAPSLGSAHPRSGGKTSAATRSLDRGLLTVGDRGPAVAALQDSLGLTADGIFGPKTLKAVRAFQRSAGLVVDGVAGPLTRAALSESLDDGLLEFGDKGRAVARVQNALGISADGIFGRQTLRAVRAFQRGSGLLVDGIVGPRTLASLDGASATPVHRHNQVDRGGRPATKRNPPPQNPPEGETKSEASSVRGVDDRLSGALELADEMGLRLVSAHRPGAIIESSGLPSDHGVSPSKAIDVAGSGVDMRRYARAVAGLDGVETVIHSPVGIWTAGSGWHSIRTEVTRQGHFDHVHVDTF